MTDLINIAIACVTIVFGCIGWFAPRYTMAKLDLKLGGSQLGLSEIRAANGALFVGLSVGALWLSDPVGYAIVGFVYAGAATGRLTSIVFDGSGHKISWSFLIAEIFLATVLLTINLSALQSIAQ